MGAAPSAKTERRSAFNNGACSMFLYGDSSASPLTTNTIEVLRATIDFAAKALQAQQTIADQRERADAFRQAAAVDIGRLDTLATLVERALAGAATGAADSPASRCSASIGRSTSDIVQSERTGVHDRLSSEIAQIEAETARQQSACARTLAELVEHHDLPDGQSTIQVQSNAAGPYEVQLYTETPYGIATVVALDVPAASVFHQVFKIEGLVERLDVQAPEQSGWIQKTVKLKSQRLDRYYLVGLETDDTETTLRLRAGADGSGDGFDVVAKQGGPVTVQRIAENGDPFDDSVNADEGEAQALRDLCTRLATSATDLASGARSLRESHIDGEPIDKFAEPRAVVERLVNALAPAVQEIARRSLSPGELVLKRVVGGDRREEYFASKAELRQKIEQVSESLRSVLAPLGLDTPGQSAPMSSAQARASRPAPGGAPTDEPRVIIPPQSEVAERPKPVFAPSARPPAPDPEVIDVSASALMAPSSSKVAMPSRPPRPDVPKRPSSGLIVVNDDTDKKPPLPGTNK